MSSFSAKLGLDQKTNRTNGTVEDPKYYGLDTFPALFGSLSLSHSSHYSVTPKVIPNYRMANDLPNFGNRSTEKTLILPLLSPPFFSFPVSCLFYRDSTSLGLSSLEQWYFISTTIRMVLRHYLCHNTPRFIHET